jgi:hypothetical protein
VKTVRIWLLLLLAVLLPLRGAVAAAMLCPIGGTGVQNEVRVNGHALGHEAMDHAATHDHGAAHDDGGARHDESGHHASASDKCNMCSAFCSLTPLLSAFTTLLEPLDSEPVRFADLSAAPPSFLSDGQERPPRTL